MKRMKVNHTKKPPVVKKRPTKKPKGRGRVYKVY
jgi:hypothetical protein